MNNISCRRSARLLSNHRFNPSAIIKQFLASSGNTKVDEDLKQFVLQIDEHKAYVNYIRTDEKTIDLIHTEVPAAFRGKGVGKILAKDVFDFVKNNNLRMRLSCDYLRSLSDMFPEYRHLIIK